jgi:hypothetical protein
MQQLQHQDYRTLTLSDPHHNEYIHFQDVYILAASLVKAVADLSNLSGSNVSPSDLEEYYRNEFNACFNNFIANVEAYKNDGNSYTNEQIAQFIKIKFGTIKNSDSQVVPIMSLYNNINQNNPYYFVKMLLIDRLQYYRQYKPEIFTEEIVNAILDGNN